MQEQGVPPAERVNEMARAFGCETDEIDHDVRIERGNALTEGPGALFCDAVDFDPLDIGPGVVSLVRFSFPATGRDYLMSGCDEARNQKGANVTGCADDDDANVTVS